MTTKIETQGAGVFSSWLRRIRFMLIKDTGSNVPCGDCRGCCKSSHFIHIRPDEKATLSAIPKKLLFAAPYLPKGNKIMGYNESGCCPMLIDDRCSIYDFRSQTCRNFDCRIFAAAGISAGDKTKNLINDQLKRWKFQYTSERDRIQHQSVMKAAEFLRERQECFPGGKVPDSPSQIAIMAIKVYTVFLKCSNEDIRSYDITTGKTIANEIIETNSKFESKCKSA